MKSETFLDGRITLHAGDCMDVLARLEECSIDSVVCDPPYHLTSIVKRFGSANAAPAKSGKTGAYKRASAGFMGKQWDGGDIAFNPELWALVWRALKPGAHLVAFSGTRTYHRMACAIEDAGFEIRDQLAWCYGSGFPKSHDVSKALDKREPITAAAAAAAAGWGTALKPAWEPIVFSRKPLVGTVAENWLQHGTGPINIEACKVGEETRINEPMGAPQNSYGGYAATATATVGRWPANIVSDGSEPELRYFYSAKADADDRIGSKHPTVKPVDLMQWLVRLVTPKSGTVLDPFSGTGTTGEAAWREGMRAVLIEREAEYQDDIRRRMKLCLAGPDEKRRESLKARGLVDDAGPLFGGNDSTRGGGQTDLRSLRGRKIGPIGLKA